MPVLSGDIWVTPGQPFPTVTWSFATKNYDFSSQYVGYLDFVGQIDQNYRSLVRSAFDAWEAVSQIDFVEVTDNYDVNIRLGDIPIDGRPSPGQSTTLGTAQSWTISNLFQISQIYFDVDAYDNRSTFYQVALHEIGHAIGFDHSSDPVDTMYPLSNPKNSSGQLSAGDIAGVQQMYGVRVSTQTINTDFAAAASSLFLLGELPSAEQLVNRGDFAKRQFDYYADVLKVANPELGPYEALGAAFSNEAAFQTKYGASLSTSSFIAKAYQDAFHRAPTAAQQAHFTDQANYFRSLYTSVGIAADKAEMQARGAIAGQMLGYAMTTAAERDLPAQTLDETVNSYLSKSTVSKVTLAGVAEEAGSALGYLEFA